MQQARHASIGALLVASLAAHAACAHRTGGALASRDPNLARAVREEQAWAYEVTASPGAAALAVVATFPAGTDSRFMVMDRAETFVVGLAREDARAPGGWEEVRREGSEWKVPACEQGCRLRYRFLLADGAGTWGEVALGRSGDRAIEAPPSTWLLRPEHAPLGTALRFHVTTAPGESFVTGVFAAPGSAAGAGVYEAHAAEYMQLPYSAFGELRVHELASGTATLALLPGPLPEADVIAWAEAALSAVRGFYGRAPVPHVTVIVRPSPDDDVGFGMTMGYSGAAIVIDVGSRTTRAAFARDWVLVHELVHTALPDMEAPQHWLEEGLATYVEPLARQRQRAISAVDVWSEWATRMKQGEPGPGDEGLDRTHTWGRTYWGGALFCLVADVAIRTQTGGKASLETALRAVLAAGGNISVGWDVERVLEVGDRATGTTVLRETYAKLAKTAAPVDLSTMWHRLGVVTHGDAPVTFDDSAELAWVRRAITPP
jgi:hypothetical protein